MGGPEPCGSRWGGGGRMLFPPPTTPPRRGNAFLQPSRGTFSQAMGLAPLPRRPVATCRDGRRGCGDGGWGGGIASPPPRGSGIAEQVGPEKTASPPPPRGLRASSPVRGGGGAVPPPGGGGRASGQGCFSSSPGDLCLETVPEVSGQRHLQPRRNSRFCLDRRVLLRAGIKQRSSRRLCLGGSMAGAFPSSRV